MKLTPSSTRAAQHADGLVMILRRTPDALARDPHRAEAEPVNGQIVAEWKDAAGCSGRLGRRGEHGEMK